MQLIVDLPSRQAKMRAHTATHLLHYSIDKLLGGTKQAGSLVDNDYLRFDFACKDPLTPEQLAGLEYTINIRIAAGYDVDSQEMTMKEASATGAKAFFEDTYGDVVRVVKIEGSVENDLDLHSIELCGGIHVTNTSHIGAVKITSHSSVASGIRRIEAVTATKVVDYTQQLEGKIADLCATLDCQPKQITDKLDKILKEKEHLESDHASLQGKIIWTHLDELSDFDCQIHSAIEGRGQGCLINTSGTSLEHHNFKDVVSAAKSRRSDRNWIIYTNEGNFAIYAGTGSISAKEFAKTHGLKGGGSDQFVQGKDEKIGSIVG